LAFTPEALRTWVKKAQVDGGLRPGTTADQAQRIKELEKEFADFAAAAGMVGIKGHRSVGGFRASLYNAMPIESVKALVQTMQEFEKKH